MNAGKQDTAEQSAEILLRDNPDPINAISVHMYKEGNYPFEAPDLKGLVQSVQQCAIRAQKPLFIGEFGAPSDLGKEQARAVFTEIVSAIETYEVPLAAFWVFDMPGGGDPWKL